MKILPIYKNGLQIGSVLLDDLVAADLINELIRLDSWGYPVFFRDHREWKITNYIMGDAQGLVIDHIDGNKLNATRANLRWVSKSENAINAPAHKDNITGFKGVSKHCQCNTYRARLKIGTLRLEKNGFKTAIDAAKQINSWIIEHNLTAPLNQV